MGSLGILHGKDIALNATKSIFFKGSSLKLHTSLQLLQWNLTASKFFKSPLNVSLTSNLVFYHNRVARSQSDASTFFSKPESASSTLPRHGFSRFEEKKRHNQEMRAQAVKSLFRKTPTKLGSPKSRDRRALSPESHSAILDLDQFLQTLPQNAAHHAYSFLRVQAEKLDRLVSSGVLTPLEISDRVHNIYQVFDDKLKNHSGFLGMVLRKLTSILLMVTILFIHLWR